MYAPQIYNILCFEHGNRRSIKYVGLDFLLHRHKKRRFLCKFVEYITKVVDKRNQDIAYFLSFCIEQYKNAKGIDGTDAMEIFLKYGVLDYLNEHFEILHTQNRQWILEDIDEFIELRKDKRI